MLGDCDPLPVLHNVDETEKGNTDARKTGHRIRNDILSSDDSYGSENSAIDRGNRCERE